MRPLTRLLLLAALLPSLAAAASAQSVWDKLKQATREVPRPAPTSSQPANGQRPGSAAASQGFTPTAETGTPELTASLAASAGFLDVTGIKLGMRVKDAMVALKAHNSLLTVKPETYSHELIPDQTLVSGVHAGIPVVGGQMYEKYEVAFSTQPSEGFVTAIERTVHYPPGQQPTYTSAIEGMRAKYGKENFVPRAAPTGPSFFWIMDLQGHLIQSPDLQRIVETCTSPFLAIEWQSAAHTVTLGYDERKLAIGAIRCSSYAIVSVYFQGSLIPGQSTYLLDNLTVVASNGALYRSAVEATHSQYLAAQKKVDADKMNKANQKEVVYE